MRGKIPGQSPAGRGRPTRNRNADRASERLHRLQVFGTMAEREGYPGREERSPHLRLLAHHVELIALIDEMLILREEVDETNRVIVPTSINDEVI